MPNSAALKHLSKNPHAFMQWQATGRRPCGDTPKGPLIDLLRALSPRDRAALRGVTVNRSLGYNGSRMFASAEQALRWAAPSPEVFGSFPAQSWLIRNAPVVSLDALLLNTARAPDGIRERYPQLCSTRPPTSDATPSP